MTLDPLLIVAIPISLFLFILCGFFLKELIRPTKRARHTTVTDEVEEYVAKNFKRITAGEAWRRHSLNAEDLESRLYIRVGDDDA